MLRCVYRIVCVQRIAPELLATWHLQVIRKPFKRRFERLCIFIVMIMSLRNVQYGRIW